MSDGIWFGNIHVYECSICCCVKTWEITIGVSKDLK